jgi:hypothetical protein
MVAKQTEHALAKAGMCLPTLPVMVVLGNPRNPDCSQHGICRIYEAGNEHEACNCQHQTFAWLSSTDPGTICLVFQRNFIRPESLNTHFSTDLFQVDYPFTFSDALVQRMQYQKPEATVQPGAYPIVRYADRLEVRFDV